MNSPDKKIIKLSKTKTLFLIAGSFLFAGAGFWMFQLDSAEIERMHRLNNPLIFHGIGAVAIIFAAFCIVVGIKKLFDSKPGLVLSAAGILDNSSGVSAGLIPWSEITGFSIFGVHKQKMLIILVSNPEKYIEKGNALKRAVNRANFKLCGSPVALTSNTLQIRFGELVDLCNEYFKKYKELHC